MGFHGGVGRQASGFLKSGSGGEVVLEQDRGPCWQAEPRLSLSNLAATVHAKIAAHEEVIDLALRPDSLGGEAGKGISSDRQSVHALFEADACSLIGSHRRLGLGGAFVLAGTDVGIAKGVPADRVALRGRRHAHGKAVRYGEGVRAERAAAGVTQVDAAFEVVGDHVGAQRDAIAIAIENQGCAVALFDHVTADHGAVGVLDDDAVAEVVVDVVAVHAQVEGIRAAQGVLVFLKVVRVHHDVVAVKDIDAALFIVGQNAVGDARVLEAAFQVHTVTAVMVDRHAFEVNLLDALGEDAVAALFTATDAQISQLHTPEAGFFVLVEIRRAENEGWGAGLVLVLDVRGGTGAYDACVPCFHPERLGDLVEARRDGHEPASLRDGI